MTATLLFLLLASLYVFAVASFSVQSDLCSGLSGAGTKKSERVCGVPVHRTYLSSDQPDCSAWCFSTTVALDGDDADAASAGMANFLATQVWPSARVASFALKDLLSSEDRRANGGGGCAVCELGCGPGLPSLTAARHGARSVLATDLDPFALRLVEAAAERQGLTSKISAAVFDLTSPRRTLPIADLYVLSDAFESSVAARGAAMHTVDALSRGGGARVWVFAQSDRAQREVYREELRRLFRGNEKEFGPLDWSPVLPGAGNDSGRRLWLCDVDETKVRY